MQQTHNFHIHDVRIKEKKRRIEKQNELRTCELTTVVSKFIWLSLSPHTRTLYCVQVCAVFTTTFMMVIVDEIYLNSKIWASITIK